MRLGKLPVRVSLIELLLARLETLLAVESLVGQPLSLCCHSQLLVGGVAGLFYGLGVDLVFDIELGSLVGRLLLKAAELRS